MAKFTIAMGMAALVCSSVAAPAKLHKRAVQGPVISQDFADPGLYREAQDSWFAYSTSSSAGNIPYAQSSDFQSWHVVGDALPNLPPDVEGGVWAPEVVKWADGDYRMYISVKITSQPSRCIGVATANNPAGPFSIHSSTIACDTPHGGDIDAAVFTVPNGPRFLVWKVDGNSKGGPTDIIMKKLTDDGLGLVDGDTIRLFTNGQYDGGVVEAPACFAHEDWYYCTFSSNVYSTPKYDISYATARSPEGPWTKASAPDAPILVSKDGGPQGPGHAGVVADDTGVNFVFAALANGQNVDDGRYMWIAPNACVGDGKISFC